VDYGHSVHFSFLRHVHFRFTDSPPVSAAAVRGSTLA
jgi:hypothetical protein